MLNKSLVIAALTSSASAAVAAAAKPAAGAAAAKPAAGAAAAKPAAGAAAAKPAVAAKVEDPWEDLLGRDLCDDSGTFYWEKATKDLKKATDDETALQKKVDAAEANVLKLKLAWDKLKYAKDGTAAIAKVAAVTASKAGKFPIVLPAKEVAAVTAVEGVKGQETRMGKIGPLVTTAQTNIKTLYETNTIKPADVDATKATEKITANAPAGTKNPTVAPTDDRDTKYGLLATTVTTVDSTVNLGGVGGLATKVIDAAKALQTALKNMRGQQANLAANMQAMQALDNATAKAMPTGLKDSLTTMLTAQWTAQDAKNVNDLEISDLRDQTNKVSYLFRVVRRLKATEWDAVECEKGETRGAAGAPLCEKSETTKDDISSTWTWPVVNNCHAVNGTKKCWMRGLRSQNRGQFDSTATTGSTPTDVKGLIEIVDDLYGAGDYGNGIHSVGKVDGGTGALKNYNAAVTEWNTKSKAAVVAWGNLTASYMAAYAYTLSCWKKAANGTPFADGDFYSWCVALDLSVLTANAANTGKAVVPFTKYYDAAGKQYWHPLLQGNKLTAAEPFGAQDAAAKVKAGKNQYAILKKLEQTVNETSADVEDVLGKWRKADNDTRGRQSAGINNKVPIDNLVDMGAKAAYLRWIRKALDEEETHVATELATRVGYLATNAYKPTDTYALTKVKAYRDWTTFEAANKQTEIDKLTAAAGGAVFDKKALLKTAITNMNTLVKQGTDLNTANTNWTGARDKYDTDLTAFNNAKTLVARFSADQAYLLGSDSKGVAWMDATVEAEVKAAAGTSEKKVLDLVAKSVAENATITASMKLLNDWHTEQIRAGKAAYDAAAKQYNLDVQALIKAKGDKINQEAAIKGAKAQCHTRAFADAQEDRKKKEAADKKIKAAQKALQDAYAKASAFPADAAGAVQKGGLCTYDTVKKARTPCAKGATDADTLCCGAAQRFLKDGTKLVVETCQLATATTYLYYPEMKDGALKAPTPETWRFQCISAAQKLAAAATAALAAGYMMA